MASGGPAVQVMVVEDVVDIREALCEMLAFEGYHPIGCRDGEGAWRQLTCGLRPGVIVTDLALRGLSGRQLVGRIREQTWGRHVPVLLLSGWENPDRLNVAADLVLPKGSDPVTIARAVDRLARRDLRRDPPSARDRRPPRRASARPAPGDGRSTGEIALGIRGLGP